MSETETGAAVVIFVLTYVGLAVGSIPGLRMDRTGIALVGAVSMLAFGVESVDVMLAAMPGKTMALFFGMMVIVAQLRASGVLGLGARSFFAAPLSPRLRLLLFMTLSAGLAAVITNDLACLSLAPILAVRARPMGLRPMPFLLGLAMAANIGSAATIVGNPQIMFIAQSEALHFASYALWSLVPVILSLVAAWGLIIWLASPLTVEDLPVNQHPGEEPDPAVNWVSAMIGISVTLAVFVLFFTSIPRVVVVLTAAAVLLMNRRITSRSLLAEVDWSVIILLASLGVVVSGIQATGLPHELVTGIEGAGVNPGNPAVLVLITAVLSNLVNNIPAVMLLVETLSNLSQEQASLIALASTFAGNFIVIGSLANMIALQQAAENGITISFWQHARIGIPVTCVSLAILTSWSFL